jgi:four helix bundle protein
VQVASASWKKGYPVAGSYRELIVWQKAMDLVVEVYRLTQGFPACEQFGLVNQVRRAAVSVPSNIAEGQGRRNRKQFAQYLRISRGSLQEVETQLQIAGRLGYLDRGTMGTASGLYEEVGRLLAGMLRAIEKSD